MEAVLVVDVISYMICLSYVQMYVRNSCASMHISIYIYIHIQQWNMDYGSPANQTILRVFKSGNALQEAAVVGKDAAEGEFEAFWHVLVRYVHSRS